MRRAVWIVVWLTSACGAAPPRVTPADPTVCQRLDERAGVAPAGRRRCWEDVADRTASRSVRAHAEARAAALAGRTEEETLDDSAAGWALPPRSADRIPAAATQPEPSRAPCLTRAEACDRPCGGSAGWAACLSRCDEELARCLHPPK